MENVTVYLSAIGFFLAIFPIHIFNYFYINTEQKYASLNACAYRFIRVFNLNTVENHPGEIQINGKEKQMNQFKVSRAAYKILNSLCIYKIVQLADFGTDNEYGAYVALAHNAFTQLIYKFIKINRFDAKLTSYAVISQSHGYIRYYAKAVTIINGLVIAKIFLILIMEKIYELKNKKQTQR